MKKVVFFYLLSVSLTCFAQTNNNSVLWKITGNGLKEPSYLFGTMHVVPGKQFVLNDLILKCLKESKTLILELDPNIPLSEQVKLAQRMLLPQGTTIKDYIDSIQYVQFYSYLRDSLKIKEEKINRYLVLKPVFMQTMIFMEFIENPKTYEKELKDLAGKKKNFLALETIDEQLNILDSIPFEQQLSLDFDKFKIDKDYYKLLNLYLDQDLEGLDSLMFSDPDFVKVEYNLLSGRNLKWITKFKDAMAIESSFMAVGCAHLIGDKGLINLLKNEGYTLTPINFTNEIRK